MQSNAVELTRRLLGALDAEYNVIDMPAVVEIISLLEKVVITKELLETTRLGKHVNDLRRKTTDDQLSKRAKGLLKKWRSMVLPDSNGQARASPPLQQQQQPAKVEPRRTSPPLILTPPTPVQRLSPQVSPTLAAASGKKRPAKDSLENVNVKRPRANGASDFDFSDNSNSSFKDVIGAAAAAKSEVKREVIVINSDSNSSAPEKADPVVEPQTPKKRGRKKGSKNHKNLLDEAESSFSNKLAVSASRGNSKVKTTQELLASIQNKNSIVKPKEDLIEKAAKLTERVSIIDQKLNTNASRNKHSLRGKYNSKNEKVIESGSVINDKSLIRQEEEEIIVVDDIEGEDEDVKEELSEPDVKTEENTSRSLTIEEAYSLLPPVDRSVLYEDDGRAACSCYLKENKSDFSVEDEEVAEGPKFEFVEDEGCRAKAELEERYHLRDVPGETLERLHTSDIPNVNGNYGLGEPKPGPKLNEDGLYDSIVPNVYEKLDRTPGETYNRYSDSERTESAVFSEWFECLERESYDGETLKILPYVIID